MAMALWTGRLAATRILFLAMGGVLLLTACGDADLAGTAGPDPKYSNAKKRRDPVYSQSIFGDGGLSLGGSSASGAADDTSGLGVNSFLWRASLDTLSFMPLASADPFGGVIITDWYAPPETPNERFKLNIYILGRQLRADGVKAAVFRQRRDAGGNWTDAAVEGRTSLDLENVILTRARQLRIESERP